jgi:hypothetical protein
MTGLDYFTFIVLAVLIAAVLIAAFLLGELPGRVAADRGHPQADAIRVAGWIGILTLGLFWPLALVWAFTRPAAIRDDDPLRREIDRLCERVAALEPNVVDPSGEGGGNA